MTDYKKKYYDYLKSSKWKNLRNLILGKRGRVCERCSKDLSNEKADLHHKTYENVFNEKEEDLEILCRPCHEKEHKPEKAIRFIKSNFDKYFIEKQENYSKGIETRRKKRDKKLLERRVKRQKEYNKKKKKSKPRPNLAVFDFGKYAGLSVSKVLRMEGGIEYCKRIRDNPDIDWSSDKRKLILRYLLKL
ncbi:MAG: hypothetical protein CMH22_06250 [Methylophaga sp.]|nr:hypothetical protein [Methylophaga sp.]